MCESLYTELTGVAHSFAQTDEDVFFGVINANGKKEQEIFSYHGFKNVPHLCASKAQAKRENLGYHFFQLEDILSVRSDSDLHETQVLLDFVNKRFSRDV
jgi:hypothetical protein